MSYSDVKQQIVEKITTKYKGKKLDALKSLMVAEASQILCEGMATKKIKAFERIKAVVSGNSTTITGTIWLNNGGKDSLSLNIKV